MEKQSQQEELSDRDSVFASAQFIIGAGNRMLRRGGYSPSQWVLGEDVRLPTDLGEHGEDDNLAGLDELESNPNGEFSRLMKLRNAAAISHLQGMASRTVRTATLRGAMNRDQEEFQRGHVVFYWKPVGKDSEGDHRAAKRYGQARTWAGPARLIGRDVHGWWLVHKG